MKILLVEDDDEDVEILEHLLDHTGMAIESLTRVGSLGDALNSLESNDFDLVLFDLSLPDVRGPGSIRLLLELRPELPVVVLTGDVRFAIESLRSGAQDYLVKHELEPRLLERTLRYSRERKQHENEIIELKGKLEEAGERLAKLAMTDPLTGLGNRRDFDATLDSELRRAQRFGSAVGLMLVDLDQFKEVNDGHGHEVGDRVLCATARALVSAARRAGEGAFRIGGDEFALIMACKEGEDFTALATRIARHFAAERSVPNVTLSLGSSIVKGGMADASRVLKRSADRALYAAKNGGGNRHVFKDALGAVAGE